MNKVLFLIISTLFTTLLLAQPSNTLSGKFLGSKKNTYSSFDFKGNGFVVINENINGEYFHENDSLFIFTGVDVAIYEVSKAKLRGISQWVKKETLKQIDSEEGVYFPNPKRAKWLKEYYTNNYLIQYKVEDSDEKIQMILSEMDSINERLCKEGFDLGCVQNFSYLTLQLMIDNFQTVDKSSTKFDQLKAIAQRVIELNNPDGYGLMYSYYVMKDEENKGEEFLEKGLSEGSQLCLKLSLDRLSLEQ